MIDKELYSKIHELLPISCLDIVIIDDGKVLLVKRNRKPAEGQYWLPGGRILRNESFADAAKRLVLGETGLHINAVETLGVDNLIFTDDPFGHGQGTHTVTVVTKCVPVTTDVKVDGNHDNHIWWDPKTPLEGLHEYVTSWADAALGF